VHGETETTRISTGVAVTFIMPEARVRPPRGRHTAGVPPVILAKVEATARENAVALSFRHIRREE
jgi:hypothetical protein